jgi:hypothetical protein
VVHGSIKTHGLLVVPEVAIFKHQPLKMHSCNSFDGELRLLLVPMGLLLGNKMAPPEPHYKLHVMGRRKRQQVLHQNGMVWPLS